MAERYLDCLGEACPVPLMKTQKELESMQKGDILVVGIDHTCAMKNVPANENNVEIKEISKKICLVIGDNDEIYVNIFQNYTIMEYSSKKVLQDMIMHMFENLKRVPSTDLGVFFDPLYDLIIFTQTELIEEEDMELPDELKEIILYFSQNVFEDQLECFL